MISVTYCRDHTPNKVVLCASLNPTNALGHDIYDDLDVYLETHIDIGTVDIDDTNTNLAYLEANYQADFI